MSDACAHRSAATASPLAAHHEGRDSSMRARLERLLPLDGSEHALDVGTGAGAVALALAPLVAEIVGVDVVPELLDEARRRSPPSITYLEADAVALPFDAGTFDLVATAGMLHHMPRPDIALAEMARVLRPGGTMLVIDRIAPAAHARIEHADDASTGRILTDAELRGLLAATGVELHVTEIEHDPRGFASSLDHAEVAWYILAKPGVPRAANGSAGARLHGTR